MRIFILMFFLFSACLGLASCGTDAGSLYSMDYTPAQLAEAPDVMGCKPLGQITGYSQTTSSRNVPLARLTARDDLLDRAGKNGATHVVFEKYVGARKPLALGKAFKCD
jgi:hypothetical protein